VTENESVQNVTFASNGGTAHGYLALPASGRGPGVVVIQEWWGLTTHMTDVTDRLAAEGFVALAPDLFGGTTTHDSDEAGRLMQELPVDKAAHDLGGAVDFLLGHEAVTSSTVGAVGFCMGGGFVLVLAAQQGDRIGAAVPFYGVLKEDYPDLSGLTAPVLGHFGTEDGFTTPDAARALAERIEKESGVRPTSSSTRRATRSSTTRTCWVPTTRSRRRWPGAARWSSCTSTLADPGGAPGPVPPRHG
jgi:carboxymethylenebutenolidase